MSRRLRAESRREASRLEAAGRALRMRGGRGGGDRRRVGVAGLSANRIRVPNRIRATTRLSAVGCGGV